MEKSIKILVSNFALPTTEIGSWTTRISYFLTKQPIFFDYILSPSNSFETSVFCKKRHFITWKRQLRKLQLLNWVAFDYLKQLKKISRLSNKLIVVVLDDPHLIEAIGLIKKDLKCDIELIFSFHGFQLSLNQKVIDSIDKILFLSKMGYEATKANYLGFPKGCIIGNAVDSNVFYPLNTEQFKFQRQKIGYNESDEILMWMANDRPKKGFHIFKAVVEKLVSEITDLKILILGTNQTINHPNVKSIGRIPNSKVATYLQIGNYYMFTTLYEEGFGLSMIEAYKCGNTVFASNRGAISEVLSGLKNTYLIHNPHDIDSWVSYFKKARTNSIKSAELNIKNTSTIWNYEDWELKFKKALET